MRSEVVRALIVDDEPIARRVLREAAQPDVGNLVVLQHLENFGRILVFKEFAINVVALGRATKRGGRVHYADVTVRSGSGTPLAQGLVVVSINVAIWALVSGTSGHLAYPWPVWVAGPYGAALFAVSAGVTLFRRGRAPGARPWPVNG